MLAVSILWQATLAPGSFSAVRFAWWWGTNYSVAAMDNLMQTLYFYVSLAHRRTVLESIFSWPHQILLVDVRGTRSEYIQLRSTTPY